MKDNNQVIQIPIEDLVPNRSQPRIVFDEKALNDLANSIKQHGIIQPLVVKKLGDKYEIVAGERRYKAAQIAGLVSVPGIVADINEQASAEIALVENIQREDLSAIEEAKSYKNILDAGDMTQEELAKKMGLSQSSVANKLRLLNLTDEAQKALLDGKISERHARSLLSVTDKNKQVDLLNRVIEERLTVRQLDDIIKSNVTQSNDGAMDDVPLVDMNNNLEEMKKNATDINFADTQSGAQPSGSKFFRYTSTTNPNNVFESDKVTNLGRPQLMPQESQFFNFGPNENIPSPTLENIKTYEETNPVKPVEVMPKEEKAIQTGDKPQKTFFNFSEIYTKSKNDNEPMPEAVDKTYQNEKPQVMPKETDFFNFGDDSSKDEIQKMIERDKSSVNIPMDNIIEEVLDVDVPSNDGIENLYVQPNYVIFDKNHDDKLDVSEIVDELKDIVNKLNVNHNIEIEEKDDGNTHKVIINIKKDS